VDIREQFANLNRACRVQEGLSLPVDEFYHFVEGHNCVVSQPVAHRFVKNAKAGFFNCLDSEFARCGLIALPFESLINLYESAAKYNHPENSHVLSIIHEVLPIKSDAVTQTLRFSQNFFGDISVFDDEWRTRGGLSALGETLECAFKRPQALSETDKLFEFLSDVYADYCGRKRPSFEIGCIGTGEFGTYDHPNRLVKLSSSLFTATPMSSLSLWDAFQGLFHEHEHAHQHELADLLDAGQIDRGGADYVAAKIFSANYQNFEYTTSQDNLDAYNGQPVEVLARQAGSNALNSLIKIYVKSLKNVELRKDFAVNAPKPL